LHTLDLYGTSITDDALTHLGKFCKALRKIDLTAANISEVGVSKLAEGCSNLEEVELMYCGNVHDMGVYSLAQVSASRFLVPFFLLSQLSSFAYYVPSLSPLIFHFLSLTSSHATSNLLLSLIFHPFISSELP
jgi:hypothetical protein